MAAVSILIVDDHQLFREAVRMVLQMRADFHVIAEAADGMEAVQAARALQPDVILLDINLPKLNGLEAGRQIRTVAPRSKILLLSQESSSSFMYRAFRFGAGGYVQKARAYEELIPAIDSVLKGIRFVGSGVRDSWLSKGTAANYQHHVQFYSEDRILLESFGRHVASALKAGDTAFVVATESHLDALGQGLRLDGFDLDSAIQQGTYVAVNATTALSNFIVGDVADSVRFFERAKGFAKLAEAANRSGHRVVACGETTYLLCAEGKIEAAIQGERLWNEVVKTHGVDALCAYSLDAFQDNKSELLFEKVCAEHSSFSSR
jgi:DNA-binding NarL/FixJ family response regulator